MSTGLNQKAWDQWLKYRNQGRRKLNPMSQERQAKKLESFGEHQLLVVEQSIERGWTGLFPLPKKQMQELEKNARGAERDKRLFAELRSRAEKIGFRMPVNGEELSLYRMLVERAEHLSWQQRRGLRSVGEILGAKS